MATRPRPLGAAVPDAGGVPPALLEPPQAVSRVSPAIAMAMPDRSNAHEFHLFPPLALPRSGSWVGGSDRPLSPPISRAPRM